MKAVFIYALKDPITGAIRYIGRTTNPKKRFGDHLTAVKKEKNHRSNWIRSLCEKGLKPELELLAQVPESEWKQNEIDYIAVFRSMDCDLVNGTDGGDRGPSWAGKKHSLEARAKIGDAHRGKHISLETRSKLSAANKGKLHSPETCAKIRAAQIGRKQSPYTIAKRTAKTTGKKRTLETREKLSAATKLQWERKWEKANGDF